MPAVSVRATWHGLAPSFGGGGCGLGGMVVDGLAGFRGPGWPNGPPSPRLAPGGFYSHPAQDTGSTQAGAGPGAQVRL